MPGPVAAIFIVLSSVVPSALVSCAATAFAGVIPGGTWKFTWVGPTNSSGASEAPVVEYVKPPLLFGCSEPPMLKDTFPRLVGKGSDVAKKLWLAAVCANTL